jgi:hypothetical protein
MESWKGGVRLSMKAWARRALTVLIVLAFAGSTLGSIALAASTYKAKTTCKLYSKISRKARTRKVAKGRAVGVYDSRHVWQGLGGRHSRATGSKRR